MDTQVLEVPLGKRMLLRACAGVLCLLGAPSAVLTTVLLKSVWPLLAGLYLAFIAYWLLVKANQTMQITDEGVLLGTRRKRQLLRWEDIHEFAQGVGIDRFKVAYVLAADLPHSEVNLGLASFSYGRLRHLPDNFGMRADALATQLETARRKHLQRVVSRDDDPAAGKA